MLKIEKKKKENIHAKKAWEKKMHAKEHEEKKEKKKKEKERNKIAHTFK